MNPNDTFIDLRKFLHRHSGKDNHIPSADDTSPEVRKWLELADVMLHSDSGDAESEFDSEAA